jgi:hypothetical protein
MSVAPSSSVRLLATRTGHHRVALDHGRIRAKIWAPPGHFGVAVGDARFIDLGCEFELTAFDGAGSLTVTSGWVAYDRGSREVLVPAGHLATYSRTGIGTPARTDASNELREALRRLDQLSSGAAGDEGVRAAAEQVARAARDTDQYALLSMLTRHPKLASGSAYTRLHAILFGERPLDEGHRARWIDGDVSAVNEWWSRLPRQPKAWWLDWQDAF